MLTLHSIVHAKSICPMVTILILDSGDSLWISDWWYTFVGPAGGLRIWGTVCRLAVTFEADLVFIDEKLGGSVFTFCFTGAGR